MKVEVVKEFTPEDAEKLLANSVENRNLSRRRVNAMAESIKRDGWIVDGAPIRLDDGGRMRDGQHRCAAIVQAGVTVKDVVLIRGLGPESDLAIDSGRVRSFNDFLKMQGVANGPATAAATRLLFNLDTGNYATEMWRQPFASNAALWHYYQEHADEIADALKLAEPAKKHLRMLQSVLVSFAVLALRVDENDAEEFFGQLSYNIDPEPPVKILQRTMRNAGDRGVVNRTGSVEQRIQLAYVIKTWNRWRVHDHSHQVLRFHRHDTWPEMDDS